METNHRQSGLNSTPPALRSLQVELLVCNCNSFLQALAWLPASFAFLSVYSTVLLSLLQRSVRPCPAPGLYSLALPGPVIILEREREIGQRCVCV